LGWPLGLPQVACAKKPEPNRAFGNTYTDKAALLRTIGSFNTGAGQGFEEGTTGATEGTPDTGQSFTADDTEYNIFNTDRRLEALRSISEKLARVQQKKS